MIHVPRHTYDYIVVSSKWQDIQVPTCLKVPIKSQRCSHYLGAFVWSPIRDLNGQGPRGRMGCQPMPADQLFRDRHDLAARVPESSYRDGPDLAGNDQTLALDGTEKGFGAL